MHNKHWVFVIWKKKRYQVIWKNLFIGFKRRLPKVPHLPSVTWEPFMPWGWEA